MRALRFDLARMVVAAGALSATGCEGVLGLDHPQLYVVTGSGGTGGTTTGGSGGSTSSDCTPGEVTSCYDGPEGTAGVGICQAGTRTCLPGVGSGKSGHPRSGKSGHLKKGTRHGETKR